MEVRTSFPLKFPVINIWENVENIYIFWLKETETRSSEARSCFVDVKQCQMSELIYILFGNSMDILKWSEVKLLSHVWLFETPWTIAHQASPSMGFSRQEYWRGLSVPSPGYLPDPGIAPCSYTLRADALTSEPPGKPWCILVHNNRWLYFYISYLMWNLLQTIVIL